jgi:hypothetical protein
VLSSIGAVFIPTHKVFGEMLVRSQFANLIIPLLHCYHKWYPGCQISKAQFNLLIWFNMSTVEVSKFDGYGK